MKIYQHIHLDCDSQARLLAALPEDAQLTIADELQSEQQKYQSFSECDIAFGNVPSQWLLESEQLRWLQLESVGFDAYNDVGAEFSGRGVITNLHGYFGIPVSESALAGILSLKRATGSLVSLKERRMWVGAPMRSSLTLLHNAKVLLAGGGNISHTFAELISGFKPCVTIYDRHKERGDIDTAEQFDLVLPESDIVFSSLPDNATTKFFFDERRFSLMKRGAIFVNVGRGAVVDEMALYEALMSGRIAGAVLDVTCCEPLPDDSPLWDAPNLILTQHTGGGMTTELQGKVDIFIENLKLFAEGKELTRVVKFK